MPTIPVQALQPVAVSATAVPGQTDQKDFFVYGAGVMADGGSGDLLLFTTSKSQPINYIASSSYPSTAASNQAPAFYRTHSDQTTNLVEPSKFGSLGDGTLRSICLTADQAKINPQANGLGTSSANGISVYGATLFDLQDIISKVTFLFKIATKEELQNGFGAFPAMWGAVGSGGTTANNTTNIVATNGMPGIGKQFRFQPRIMRYDTITGTLRVAAGSTLSFIRSVDNTASSGNSGQPVLVWCHLIMAMDQDRR